MKTTILFFLVLAAAVFAARSWEEIAASKELRIGIRVREGVLSPEKNSGFHYDLARAFAKKQGLTLKLVVKNGINDYFVDGLWNEVDVVCDNITILPERAEKMKFVEFLAIKQILVTKKGHIPLTSITRLADETIIVSKDSSYYVEIQKKESENKLTFKYFFSASTADQIKDLMAGKGTVTILDSNLAAEKLLEDELSLHKAISARQMIGWGVEKSQAGLAAKLTEFLEESRRDVKSGLFANVWTKYIQGISYDEYLKIAQ